MNTKKTAKTILQQIRTIDPIDTSWCDSLIVENERFDRVSISVSLNEFNFLTHININFHAKNPPGFIYTGNISISDFTSKEELTKLINKQVKLANTSINDAILRANQYHFNF